MTRRAAKARLRQMVLARRDAVDAATRAALSQAILRKIAGLPAYREARAVLAYAGFGSELQTSGFLRHVLDEGKALLLPRVNRKEKLLEVYEVVDPERDLQAGTWGISEPAPERCSVADPLDADFVLVPGVAFDARGGRLGYGAGFYDRLISTGLPPRAWLVAGAFEAQMVEEVPMDDNDVPVDAVVTEKTHYHACSPHDRTTPRPT